MICMNDVTIIALVGMPGAGKSLCVDHLMEKGWPSVYLGGITLKEVERRGLEVNPVNEKIVREEIRAHEGMGAYAARIIPEIEVLAANGANVVIADGLYSWSEYKTFKENYGDKAVVIAITAPRKTRHARLANRPVRPLTEAEVSAREYAEIENIEKGGPIANADYTICNTGTADDLLADLDSVIAELGL